MNILIVNDDGYRGPGLHALIKALKDDHNLTVAVPAREKSGTSSSVTFLTPLVAEKIHLHQVDHDIWMIDGTPADCTVLALDQLVDTKPDLIISGMNNGANVADSIIYSGTIAAALQGAFQGIPTFALSADFGCQDFQTLADIFKEMLPVFMEREKGNSFFYSLNFPALSRAEIKGVKTTTISNKRMVENFERRQNPYGTDYFWHVYDDVNQGSQGGYAGPSEREGDYLTDVEAVAQGYISLTPIKLDYLDHEKLKKMDGFDGIFSLHD